VLKKKKKVTAKKKTLKKKVARKSIKKKTPVKPKKKALKTKKTLKPKKKKDVIGIITHYFPKVRAAVIKLKAPLVVGDSIKIKGHTTDFTENVESIQIDRIPIKAAKKGQEIGILVNSRVRQHDVVYKV